MVASYFFVKILKNALNGVDIYTQWVYYNKCKEHITQTEGNKMRVKEWKYNQIMSEACKYGDIWQNLDVERDPDFFDTPKLTDGFVKFTCRVEVIKETEKALYVNLGDSFKTWIPKSAIA